MVMVMNRAIPALIGMVALFIAVFAGGLPPASAQSQQQIDEMCAELRKMDAEMAQMDNPQMRQMLERQFAQVRQQCAPGFAARLAAQTPPAPDSAAGRYRLVVEQHRQIHRQLPGGSFTINDVHRARAEFTVAPGQREFNGKGTIEYVSADGTFLIDNCRGRMGMTPLTHPANVNVRMNPDGQTVFVLVDDMNTGGMRNAMSVQAICPDQSGSAIRQMLPEDDVFVKNLPLRHGAQVTEVSEMNGIRNTVKATLHKL